MTKDNDITQNRGAGRGLAVGAADPDGLDALDPAGIPEHVRQKVSIISAHFLLSPGARIADMGCGRGQDSFVLALLNPRARIVGIDRDPLAIAFAKEHYQLPNLSFEVGDVLNPDMFEDGSLDGILNSNILNRLYSERQYNATKVSQALKTQTAKLKPGGKMVICDYISPPLQEFALLELPDEPSTGPEPEQLSDADLLISFSHTARPLARRGSEGFFLEELPRRKEGTRLFRLPHKWALEFVLRKDYRSDWDEELKFEYSYFTRAEFQRELAAIGMRTTYLSPYWNPWVVTNRFDGKFCLYSEDGVPLDSPPTSFFVVSQRVGEEASIILQERRPSQHPVSVLEIDTVQENDTGRIFDIIRRRGSFFDVIPYRMTKEGRLVIYARHDFPRPIVNAVPRGSPNLDGKEWSGHLIEPIEMDADLLDSESRLENLEKLRAFLKKIGRLNIARDDSLFVGPVYYPAPDFLEIAIEPLFVEVEEPLSDVWTVEATEAGLSTSGTIRELDARDVLRASQVGLLPEARLEVHIFTLMRRLGIEPPPWVGEKVELHLGAPERKIESADELKELLEENTFADMEGERGVTHKIVRSVFSDDGLIDGAQTGLGATEIEFVIPRDEESNNIAVLMPLTRDISGEILMALEPKCSPVPNRLGNGSSSVLGMPSFPLPRHIRTIDQAKQYLADIIGVSKDRIGRLGESYFTFIGMTPQRIYPFVVATDGSASRVRWIYAPLKTLWKLTDDFAISGDVMKTFGRSYQLLGDTSDLTPDRSPVALKKRDNALPSERTRLTRQQVRQEDSAKAREHLARVTSKGTGMASGTQKKSYKGFDGTATANLDLSDVRIDAPPLQLGSAFKKTTVSPPPQAVIPNLPPQAAAPVSPPPLVATPRPGVTSSPVIPPVTVPPMRASFPPVVPPISSPQAATPAAPPLTATRIPPVMTPPSSTPPPLVPPPKGGGKGKP